MTNEIDHEWTDEIVCPHCGYEHDNSWEFSLNDGEPEENECDRCGKTFIAKLDIIRKYSTKKLEEKSE